jgi:AraC family transcriptional regulator of arabinose operon
MPRRETVITDATEAARAFGALAHRMKDNIYVMRWGLIYTSPWVVTAHTIRHPAAILLTVGHASFELSVNEYVNQHQAVAIRPMTERGLRAKDVMLVSIQVHPNCPHFRPFRAIADPGAIILERNHYAAYDALLDRAYRGTLSIDDASRLFDEIVATTVEYLPKVKRIDSRVEKAIELLQQDATFPLKELAATLGLSYDRMSHLFSEAVGLPLKSYQLWQKAYNAAFLFDSARPLTDIAHATGFADSAHLTRIFQSSYGINPSYLMDRSCVKYMIDSSAVTNKGMTNEGHMANATTKTNKSQALHCNVVATETIRDIAQ